MITPYLMASAPYASDFGWLLSVPTTGMLSADNRLHFFFQKISKFKFSFQYLAIDQDEKMHWKE